MYSKAVIFVVIAVLVVALVYSSFTPFIVFAVIVERGPIDCVPFANVDEVQCCQTETDDKGLEIKWCTDCANTSPPSNCGPRYNEASIGETPPADPSVLPEDGVLEQPPRPPSFDPTAPLQGGVSEQQEPPTPPTFAPGVLAPFVPGFLERQEQLPPADQGAAEPPTDEGEQPRIGSSSGGCSTESTTICIPCDLGIPGASCIPKSEWPPLREEGVFEQPTQPLQPPPTTGGSVLSQPGVLQRLPADQGAVEEPPADDGTQPTQPATVENEPVPPCPEGQVIDEETGLCVLEEQETQETEEQQGSEENGSEDNTNN